ncbi:MAG TPA: pre-peptidase C-terminal domain-containing protein, partial [Chitinophagaceae bacterium]|nr:pre-peptidase C-terminal domain-containing protein [Chitinophagaceae bacterium]
IVGQAPCASNAFVSTLTNCIANCFLNNYTGTNNQSSPNIWYQFTLASPATVQLSHCGSTLADTYIHLLNSSGTQISSNDDNGPLCSGNNASISSSLAAGTYYVVSEGYGSGVGAIKTTINTISPCNSILNLTLFIENYYIGGGLMNSVMMNEGYTGIPTPTLNDVDDITVELRDAISPTTIIAITTTRLQTNGNAVCVFPSVTGNYYIVIKHRNAMQTWSKNPISFGASTISYNFSSSANQAYGDNLKSIDTNLWALYSGDIIIDENIDLIDLTAVTVDINNFGSGYISTDLNGDGNVDLLDLISVEQNIIDFIFSNHP